MNFIYKLINVDTTLYAWSMIEQLTGDLKKNVGTSFSFEFHGIKLKNN